MGLYSDHILPRFLNLMMRGKEFEKAREETLAQTSGLVLEVGFGGGLNLPFYPPAVTKVLALEPSAVAKKLAAKRVAKSPFPIEFVGLVGESIPLPDHSVDQVVTTWTLCTIPDPAKALAEFLRVLKPGGKYFFVEHGLSPEPGVARWQNRLTPMNRIMVGGCHLNRPIADIVKSSGLRVGALRNFHIKGPKFATYLYLGSAEAK